MEQYIGSIQGIDSYMEKLRTTNPKLYRQLEPDYLSLSRRQQTGQIVIYSLLGAGAVLALYGLTESAKSVSSDSYSSGSRSDGMTPMLLGFGVLLLAWPASRLLLPEPQDYLDFTNKHNRLNPRHPLRWQLSAGPRVDGGANLALNYSF